MKTQIGRTTQIAGGWDIGMDIPAGEIKITSVSTFEEDYSIRGAVEAEIKALMPTIGDILNDDSDTIADRMEEILTKKDGYWIGCHFTDRELDERHGNMVIAESDFMKMLSEDDFNNLMNSLEW